MKNIKVKSINTKQDEKKAKLSLSMLTFLMGRTLFQRKLSRKNTIILSKHINAKKLAGII